MKVYDAPALATSAVAANPARPAMAVIHDSVGARLVLFRIEPGQEVPVHTNASTVLLTVISGTGIVIGGDDQRAVRRSGVARSSTADGRFGRTALGPSRRTRR